MGDLPTIDGDTVRFASGAVRSADRATVRSMI